MIRAFLFDTLCYVTFVKQGREHSQAGFGKAVCFWKEGACAVTVYMLGSLCYPGYQLGLSWQLIKVCLAIILGFPS